MATDEPDTGPLPAQQPAPGGEVGPPPAVVPPASVPANAPDPEQLRQFEQFRQFQQFQEMQRYAQTEEGQRALAAGGGPTGFPFAPPPKRPAWQRFLRSRFFRRVVYAVIVVLILVWGYNHYFGTTEDNNVQGGAGPGPVQEPGRLSPSPQQAVIALYKLVAQGGATEACTLVFDHQGGLDFARDFGAATCEAAVTKLAAQVTAEGRDTYAAPKIGDDNLVISGASAVVSSCQLHVTGGPALGKLLLTQNSGGWVISGHQPETCASSTSPTTTG